MNFTTFTTTETNKVLKELSQLIPTPIRVCESQTTVNMILYSK